ncbi:MAG: hypothetical protein ACI9FR_001473 [Cryomorphaceae bacterium]|jgi:uncharacterized protein YehS (DUF1456 family)
MNNNDILRRLRFAFDFSNKDAVGLFSLDPSSISAMTQSEFLARLAKDEDDDFVECSDIELCAFLDGLIVSKRGLREPAPAPSEKPPHFRISKNDILKKLRIAMSYREQEMMETLKGGGSELSKSELGALFRAPGHKHYRACGGQALRNFIKGLTITLRGE